MRMLLIFLISLSILFLNGCIIEKASAGKGERCELHHRQLHKSIVKIIYGAYCGPGTHLGAGSENFPNAKHNECGGCVVMKYRFAWMYTCSECNKAKEKYGQGS